MSQKTRFIHVDYDETYRRVCRPGNPTPTHFFVFVCFLTILKELKFKKFSTNHTCSNSCQVIIDSNFVVSGSILRYSITVIVVPVRL